MTVSADALAEDEKEISYRFSDSLPELLDQLRATLLVSTYQAGQIASIGVADEKLHFTFRQLDRPMGVAVADGEMAVVTREQIWFFRDHPDIARLTPPAGQFDHCFVPERTKVTGAVQGHEIAWGTDDRGRRDLWFVNTLFSCLSGIDDEHHFVPRWKPPFISRLSPQDRCHLNGMAMRDGRPRYVSVMALSDEAAGWRSTRNDSGAVLDVPSGEPVTQGLAMPHSPRWHAGHLFVLNSGMGRLEQVDLATGQRQVVALLPGYARGLAFHGSYAFVGLSKIRETAIFGGAPIAEHHAELKCGVGVIDLRSGKTVATLEFTDVVHEIFDVQVVPDARCTSLGGSEIAGDAVWRLPADLR